jgi:EAL domain-containing protein (putative c-di-GMP-specific phosphodiesterase class I)
MYEAKRDGGARFGVVDARKQRDARHKAALYRDLRGALGRGEVFAEYQPIVAISGGTVTGVEALLRWRHPTEGVVAPGLVISLAEQSGLGLAIGHFMLAQACSDLEHTLDPGASRGIGISVNVARSQLASEDFARSVAELLAATGTDPGRVTLEVTEDTFMGDDERCDASLAELKRIGVHIALDDFGTGYSGLGYLKRLPVDVVKIDQSFVADLGQEPTSRLNTSAVVGLAHGLGMSVVAEGVEQVGQLEQLGDLGCDSYQGFYFSRSLPAVEVAAMLDGLHRTKASA